MIEFGRRKINYHTPLFVRMVGFYDRGFNPYSYIVRNGGMKEYMNLKTYITEEEKIEVIKNEYVDSDLSMKDMLNGKYSDLPIEDKINLVCWSADNERFEVLENGSIVDKCR